MYHYLTRLKKIIDQIVNGSPLLKNEEIYF